MRPSSAFGGCIKALLIVDLQNDFMPGGALGVPDADQLAPFVNSLMPSFPLVVTVQDWHPPHHLSFQGADAWPEHCIQNTHGAALVSALEITRIVRRFYKGTGLDQEGYSAFSSTGLADYLHQEKVTDLYMVGVATEYCVLYSALDGLNRGFSVYVIAQGCRAISHAAGQEALDTIRSHGGRVI